MLIIYTQEWEYQVTGLVGEVQGHYELRYCGNAMFSGLCRDAKKKLGE